MKNHAVAVTAAKTLVCDYLVIGAGASSLAFIDTLLTELPKSTKVILIDRKSMPGGHWVDAYGFVQLHQPSLLYGVASKQLEGNWMKLMMWNMMFPWKHRANKHEILAYFDTFVKDKQATGQLEFYPNCEYSTGSVKDVNITPSTSSNSSSNGSDDGRPRLHSFSSVDSQQRYDVQVNVKVVNGTAGECIIPSQNPLPFPVDDGVQVMTPNDIYDTSALGGRKELQSLTVKTKCFVVLGAGKTAMDTVVYLQRVMKVKPTNIAWVIPNDVWMLNRDGAGNPWVWPEALLEHNLNDAAAALALEEKGIFYRLDPNVKPTRFRFPVVDAAELTLMRKVKTIVRRGRAIGIRLVGGGTGDANAPPTVVVEFGDDNPSPWEVPVATADECVFIHCASPGPFNNKRVDTIFQSDELMALNLLVAPPISMSMSNIAKLEAARRMNTLDLDFGRRLLAAAASAETEISPSTNGANRKLEESDLASRYTENDVLQALVRAYRSWLNGPGELASLDPIFTLACFFALLDVDPMVAYNWQKGNRLQFLCIPGFKIHLYEDIKLLAEKGKELGYAEGKVLMFKLLADKLKPLEGM